VGSAGDRRYIFPGIAPHYVSSSHGYGIRTVYSCVFAILFPPERYELEKKNRGSVRSKPCTIRGKKTGARMDAYPAAGAQSSRVQRKKIC
jgi:hypothetical protein